MFSLQKSNTIKVAQIYQHLFVSGVVCFLILAVVTPVFMRFHLAMGGCSKTFLSFFCHQLPKRSFRILNYPIGVCGRCLGIYTGVLLTVVLLRVTAYEGLNIESSWNGRIKVWTASVFLMSVMLVEWISERSGLFEGNNLLRFISGFLFGVGWMFGPHIRIMRWIRGSDVVKVG